MVRLTKGEVERVVRAFWKKQATPRDARKPLPSGRAAEKFATTWLRSAGFDFKKAETLQAQHRAEWDRNARRAAADAARRWAGPVKRMQASAAAWANSLMTTSFGSPASQPSFIGEPISIVASNPGILKASHIESGNSFAKILVDQTSSDVDTLTFAFEFRNGASRPFVFDFDTLLNASGHLRIRSGAGFHNSGGLIIDAKLDVLTPSPVSDVRNVTALAVLSGYAPFFTSATNERTIAQTRFLTAPGIVLESKQTIVLQVSLVLNYDLVDARVTADLSTGNFRVLCPVVLVARRALP